MATFVYGLNVSLDGYVDHQAFAPGPELFRHFTEQVSRAAGSLHGRRMYEVMRYWDDDHAEWSPDFWAFARAWRKQPKWVVSRTMRSVGPNATLIGEPMEAAVRDIKRQHVGEVQVGGPELALSLAKAGLIDEYRLYVRPFVVGGGKPFFAGPMPPLRLAGHELIGEDAVRLTYVPAGGD